MVLNVMGSNPIRHPKRKSKGFLFLCIMVVRTHGFVIDEVLLSDSEVIDKSLSASEESHRAP